MSRCRCCDRILRYGELRKRQKDGKPDDMCSECVSAALYPQYQNDKVLSGLTEMDVLGWKNFTSYSE